MSYKKIILSVLLFFLLSSILYAREISTQIPSYNFAVIADPHYYSSTLGVEGVAFYDAIFDEIKLFQYSKEFLEETIKGVIANNVDFLIIPGDLTKDGELLSHLELASYLNILKDHGIHSYVVPGNHDINNPLALSYTAEGPIPAASINSEDFKIIYQNFGYGSAIFTHDDSLSYVAEPINGVWLLALDSCKYDDDFQIDRIGGRITDSLLRWITFILLKAKTNDKLVIAFMHHSLLENFNYHSMIMPKMIIENHEYVSNIFASNGLNLIFTGHTHVQDSTVKYFDNQKYALDIQTGSILTYPHPYRIASIHDNTIDIKTNYITEILKNGDLVDITSYSRSLSRDSVLNKVKVMPIMLFPPCVDESFYIETYFAHVKGDENPPLQVSQTINCLLSSKNILSITLGLFFQSIWTDLPPEDNNFQFILW